MRREFLQACLFVGALTLTPGAATAQAIVHALTGVVTSINTKVNSIHIDPDDGSLSTFDILTKPNTPLEFQKSLKAATTPAVSFTKFNEEVIVFYIGGDSVRTVVAFQDLGPGPFVKSLGTMVKFDKHTITIRNASGSEETFQVDAKTVADVSEGAVEGKKFDANKGAQVSVIATTANGVKTALFIRALTL
jgi:hypothetical protein